jgi:hypothetical protein
MSFSNDHMRDNLVDIGVVMVDQLVDGIREHCAQNPNPLLSPERHFFRELAYGMETMAHHDLLSLCAATITRIAYPDVMKGGAS